MVGYDVYDVEIEFDKRVVGATPKNPEIIESWVEARAKKTPKTEEEQEKLKNKISEEVNADEEAEKKWNTFKRDDAGLYLEDRHVKAMLREAANTLGSLRGQGSMAKKQTFQHGLFIEPYRLHLMRKNQKGELEYIKEPDGYDERAIHVMTPAGPRSSIKREDYIEPEAIITFKILVVIPQNKKEAVLTEDNLREWLELGQRIGLGGSRRGS